MKYLRSVTAIALGAGGTLALMSQGVMQLEPWFQPQKIISLAGMGRHGGDELREPGGRAIRSRTDRRPP